MKIFNIENEEVEIEEEGLVSRIVALFNEHKGERVVRENQWLKYYDAYFLRGVLPPPKYQWESSFLSPKFFYVIEQFVNIIRRSLIQSREFFKVSGTEKYEKLALTIQKLLNYYLNSYHFLEEFEKALRWGAITSEVILKIDWENKIKETPVGIQYISRPVFEAISPFDFVQDVYQRYAIHRYYMNIEDVKALQRFEVWNDFEVKEFNIKEIEKDLGTSVLFRKPIRGIVEVLEFWGTLFTNDIYPNLHLIVVNRKHIAKAEYFRYLHNSLPFVRTILFEGFEYPEGHGIMDVIYELVKSLSFLTRQIENQIVASSSNIIEIDRTRVDHNLVSKINETGLSPFQIIFKTGADPVTSIASYGQFNPNVLPIIQYYQMEIQNSTGITEFLMGLPTSKGRPTAKEIQIKTTQSIEMMDTLTSKIESKILKEVIYKLAMLIVEKEEESKIKEILSDEEYQTFSSYDRMFIAKLIQDKLAISVSGISEVMHRKDKLQQIIDFLSIASNLQASNLNTEYLIEKFAILLDFDPDRIFVKPSEEEQMRQKELMKKFLQILMNSQQDKETLLQLLEKFPLDVIVETLEGGKEENGKKQ